MTKQEFADKIGCERSSVYYLFEQESIHFDKLTKISEALQYDFMLEVYKYKKITDETASCPRHVYIAVKVDMDCFQQLNLPNDYVLLTKKATMNDE